jgi:DEAD/DEAH box helicase/Helicase conserved C-terminal domain
MATFATELSEEIRRNASFRKDLALLRSNGIRHTLPRSLPSAPESMPAPVLTRLLSSASIMASAEDELSKDLAQQIAVFSALISQEDAVRGACAHILSGLGNFPGLTKLLPSAAVDLSLPFYLRSRLLAWMNSVEIGRTEVALTNFQKAVWDDLQRDNSLAISAPTSAGKSFVVLEYLCECALKPPLFTALYIAPTRALLSEVQAKLERRLGNHRDSLRVTTIPIPDLLDRPRQIYVLTQERTHVLLANLSLNDRVDLIIVDEVQALSDEGRGMILHDVLEKLRDANPKAKFLFLAPGATGFETVEASIGLGDLGLCETNLSPVVQNRIVVSFGSDEHELKLSLLNESSTEPIATYRSPRGFALGEEARLAAVAVELGANGKSLVYAKGAAKAEDLGSTIALNRQKPIEPKLLELSKFIRSTIHNKYSLANLVLQGVGVHYGNMPTLLRDTIESSFRDGILDYLCCTTTLFQGVNLPARNVFIHTPTRGNKGEKLDSGALWNFAGRAGRLGEEVVGNVFLVDYESWDDQPLTVRTPIPIQTSFKKTLQEDFSAVLDVLTGASNRERPVAPARARAAAGLAMFRASQGSLERFLDRSVPDMSKHDREQLVARTSAALDTLQLPSEILSANWVVDPVGLARLLERFKLGLEKGEFDQLRPISPAGNVYPLYKGIVYRMYKYLGGRNLTGDQNKAFRGYVNHVATSALKWMRGDPLAQIVQEEVKFAQKSDTGKRRNEQKLIDGAVRKTFELIEDTIRFQLVQWAKAYVDVLRYSLYSSGRSSQISEIYDFSLALELGVSTTTGRSLIELGLSRISASAISSIILDSSLNVEQVRSWLLDKPESLMRLSEVILRELRDKQLVSV